MVFQIYPRFALSLGCAQFEPAFLVAIYLIKWNFTRICLVHLWSNAFVFQKNCWLISQKVIATLLCSYHKILEYSVQSICLSNTISFRIMRSFCTPRKDYLLHFWWLQSNYRTDIKGTFESDSCYLISCAIAICVSRKFNWTINFVKSVIGSRAFYEP